jgi:protein-S-isoprenylcysteine O-methyltransferase Ste14
MKPLPFVWPYAPLFWAVFMWAFFPEWKIVRRGRQAAGQADEKSLQVILFGMWMAMFLSFFLAWIPALQIRSHRMLVFLIGVAVLAAGSLLRRHCWRMLGASFTGDVRASAGQRVVTRGAYALVRHPSYTAGILMNTGIGLALGSWFCALLLAAASFAVYYYRMAVEERALLAAIGEPYRAFMRTRKRLIPFVY